MYRLKGNFNGREYQVLSSSFSEAFKTLKNSKAQANYIELTDEGGITKAVYLKGLGTSF